MEKNVAKQLTSLRILIDREERIKFSIELCFNQFLPYEVQGLTEVFAEQRDACENVINTFKSTKGKIFLQRVNMCRREDKELLWVGLFCIFVLFLFFNLPQMCCYSIFRYNSFLRK